MNDSYLCDITQATEEDVLNQPRVGKCPECDTVLHDDDYFEEGDTYIRQWCPGCGWDDNDSDVEESGA